MNRLEQLQWTREMLHRCVDEEASVDVSIEISIEHLVKFHQLTTQNAANEIKNNFLAVLKMAGEMEDMKVVWTYDPENMIISFTELEISKKIASNNVD